MDPDVAAARRDVIAAVEESLKLAPDHVESYRMLVEVHRECRDDHAMVAAANRLLARFPEEFGTVRLLARHFLNVGEPHKALPHVIQARRLKPLDESLRSLESSIRIALARQLAREGKFDEGRAEFALVEGLTPEDLRDYYYLARRAMLEYKAGQDAEGDRLVEQARATLVEPAPLWLAMAIEAVRYGMPKAVVRQVQPALAGRRPEEASHRDGRRDRQVDGRPPHRRHRLLRPRGAHQAGRRLPARVPGG